MENFFYFVEVEGEYWLLFFFLLPSQDSFSLSPIQLFVDCAVSQAWKCHFCFHPCFPGNMVKGRKKLFNIKENCAVALNEDRTGLFVCIKANVAASNAQV